MADTISPQSFRGKASAPAAGALGGVVGGLPGAPPPPPAANAVARLASMQAQADGAELGDLFEYALRQPVTIRRNQSALVPIVQAEVGVERVSLWSETRGNARPLRALWLTNDTGATLDGGSLTLVEGNAFAGEGLLDAIAPGEKRLVSYAIDLAGRVTVSHDGGPRRISRIRIANSVMTQFVEERAHTAYTLRNEDGAARLFVIEHPARDGWTFAKGGPVPAETAAGVHRFRVTVPPHASETLKLEDVHPIESRVALSTLSSDHVTLILRGRNVDPAVEGPLRAVLTQAREVARLQGLLTQQRAEVERIGADQARVRENLAALKGSAEERQLVARYTRQLDGQEDRLEALRREMTDTETLRAAGQQELARLVSTVALDVELP